jgi:UDP-2,3-diacylglucosamine pyrophosphatase LpxH
MSHTSAESDDPHSQEQSFFLSDLHLLSSRSTAPKLKYQIDAAIERAHTLILGGDIFDFRWSTHRSLEASADEAMCWLDELLQRNTDCRVHYLLGNHDCHPEFVLRLEELSQSNRNFIWHQHVLRIDRTVFLHGDVVDLKYRHHQDVHQVLDAKRLAGEMREPPTTLSHTLYDVAVRARVHRLVVQLAKSNERVLRRLTTYLTSQNLNANAGITRVFFGHTHRRMNAIDYAGLQFFNPGAAIKGLPFKLLDAGIPAVPLVSWKQSTAGNNNR